MKNPNNNTKQRQKKKKTQQNPLKSCNVKHDKQVYLYREEITFYSQLLYQVT